MSNASDFVIDNSTLKRYTGIDPNVIIPEGVDYIELNAFSNKGEIVTDMLLPNSMKNIRLLFSNFPNLQSIRVKSSHSKYICGENGELLSKDGTVLVAVPPAVETFTIPASITRIEDYAFYCCKKLTEIVIPEGVKEIGESAFSFCDTLTNIEFPKSLTKIQDEAFCYCDGLHSVVIPEGVKEIGERVFYNCCGLENIQILSQNVVIGKEFFGYRISEGLALQFSTLHRQMNNDAIKYYILERWTMLDTKTQCEIFMAHQSKALKPLYKKHLTDIPGMGQELLRKITASASKKECSAVATFMEIAFPQLPETLQRQLYETIKPLKAAQKALETISVNEDLMALLSGESYEDNALPSEVIYIKDELKKKNMSLKDMDAYFEKMYGITSKELPKIKRKDGTDAENCVIQWLLTAHEALKDTPGFKPVVVVSYDKPELCSAAEAVMAELDDTSFQNALRHIAVNNLGTIGRSKKMFLAYPICRYANETLMRELTKMAPSWRSYTSGDFAPSLLTFRKANMYSNTKAAMLFADKYNELECYANLRGIDVDVLRDIHLSDVGLDESGCKRYDLGNQIVTVKLQQNLMFQIVLPNGKTMKSLPQKDAEPDKFDAASTDLAEMKKIVKKIIKNRKDLLFANFISGHSQGAKHWQQVYMENPVLRGVANLLVWCQGDATFTLNGTNPITADGRPYTIGTECIRVAHPMAMKTADVEAWQTYFMSRNLKQPFEQIWEPVVDSSTVTEDRYKDCMIPFYRFKGREKHGIYIQDWDFHNQIDITFDGCKATVERIDYVRHEIDMNHRFAVQSISFDRFTPMVNHILAYIDRITAYDRIVRDDVSVAQCLPSFTLAQITEFIKLASENNCPNVTAILLDFQQKNFPNFDPMAEFTLD